MWIEAIQIGDIAPGGMKAVKIQGKDLVICNCEGRFYALDRRCGHAGAYMERGTLTGTILTCPLHYAQFDVETGKALSGPMPKAPASSNAHLGPNGPETHDLAIYQVRISGNTVLIYCPQP